MPQWTQAAYLYDGSFSGFLSCVFESYVHREAPACFAGPEEDRISLWPEREVASDEAHARRVYASLARRISLDGQKLVARGFLTCLPERELHLWRFIDYGYQKGPTAVRDLTDDRVAVLWRAAQHLKGETHLYRGFIRFSDQNGLLVSEIEPKNRVLPLLQPHFCNRYAGESFVIYDRTHQEALFHQPDVWKIIPLAEFHMEAPGAEELDYRQLWRRFYDTIAIEGRDNPKCRMTHMPKRYWAMMTEFQTDPPPGGARPLPQIYDKPPT